MPFPLFCIRHSQSGSSWKRQSLIKKGSQDEWGCFLWGGEVGVEGVGVGVGGVGAVDLPMHLEDLLPA